MKKLTCILTLKGRETFSKRFFEHIREINLPYKLIIGDGDPSSSVQDYLTSDAKMENIDYEYRAFNDKSPQAFFYKLETLIEQAETPYVMFCDNDDFLVLSGIEKCIQFLESNPDYTSCGGKVLGIEAITKKGNMCILREGGIYGDFSNCYSDSSLKRVITYIQEYAAPCWYNVYRKENLLKSIRLFRETGVNDFLLMELFMAFSASVQGKQHIDNSFVSYIRQTNSSQINVSIKSLLHRCIYSDVGNEIKSVIEALSNQIHQYEKADFEDIREKLRGAFLLYFERAPNDTFFSKLLNKFKGFCQRWDYTLRYTFSLYNRFRLHRDLKNIEAELFKKRSSKKIVDLFLKEYEQVRKIILHHPDCLNN